MAKEQTPENKPKVSKLPLPISDSPLVIDLPDGQKIVVGRMTSGSVIEVATWRGVGRPDSRTSRLMLGVGSGNVNEEPDTGSSPQPKKPAKPEGFAVVLFYLQIFASKITSLPWKGALTKVEHVFSPKKSSKNKKVSVANTPVANVETPVSSSVSSASDPDIEEWLNRISERAAKSNARRSTPTKSTPKKATSSRKAAPKPTRSNKSR